MLSVQPAFFPASLSFSDQHNSCCCWRTRPPYMPKELGDSFVHVPHPLVSWQTSDSKWQLFHLMPASTVAQPPLSNHDHPGEKSMLNLVCRLYGRWWNVPPGAGGQRSSQSWESLSQTLESGPHPGSSLSLWPSVSFCLIPHLTFSLTVPLSAFSSSVLVLRSGLRIT